MTKGTFFRTQRKEDEEERQQAGTVLPEIYRAGGVGNNNRQYGMAVGLIQSLHDCDSV